LLDEGRAAGFAEMLALLVEHDVPLAEGVRLAAKTSGDPRLIAAAKHLAGQISAGGVAGDADEPTAIPPLLRWLITTGGRQPALAMALRDAADTYRRRAVRRADWLRSRLPVILLLGIGGTVTVIYALALFLPWSALLYQLTKP
jgi:type II secretory pathway component PulF